MNHWKKSVSSTVLALALLAGCANHHEDHYVSPQVQGETAKINLDQVQQAFNETKGADFDTWMGNFEKRVNQIYDGSDVVSIDADHKTGYLNVVGYVEKNQKPGYQSDEEKLFAIQQTGPSADAGVPYTVSGSDNTPYYTGYYPHSSGMSSFMEGMFFAHMMNGWGGNYYTPYNQVSVLHHYRDDYRTTPAYHTQQASNKGFFSRFKQKMTGGVASKRGFGQTTSSSSGKRRSWFGGGSKSSGGGSLWGGRRSSSSSSSWGGRRSSFSGFGGRRRR
ncbi:MAG TPA: hypothetical protein V6D47_06290 [Oscillatoriaceae cyanobacterium]